MIFTKIHSVQMEVLRVKTGNIIFLFKCSSLLSQATVENMMDVSGAYNTKIVKLGNWLISFVLSPPIKLQTW